MEPALHVVEGNTFTYEPLGNNAGSIRLLWVQPSPEFDADIFCELRAVPLDENTEYVALHSPAEIVPRDRTVICDEQMLDVTSNLYFNLQLLRSSGWQWIWTAGVCVDQLNFQEHDHHQRMQHEIYKKALQVLLFVSQYKYVPLREGSQIQILQLQPALPDGRVIFCDFDIVSLDDSPEFVTFESSLPRIEKLSNCFLSCNGQLIRVPSKLHRVLALLSRSNNRRVWTDTVCIDQRNSTDIEHHVSLRDRIMSQNLQTAIISLAEYQYVPLPDGQIRLLHIHPAQSTSSPLVVDISHASLDEAPKYTALSYT